MGITIQLQWDNPHTDGLRRQDRRSGPFLAYVPSPLAKAALTLPTELSLAAAEVERRIHRLRESPLLNSTSRFLLRSEAIASSRIEGLTPAPQQVALAELAQSEPVQKVNESARLAANNVRVVRAAVEEIAAAPLITLEHLLSLQRNLLPDSPELHGVRQKQNWVGGSAYHPLDADFVPPPPQRVPALLEDLLLYANGADHSPVVQAALVHAQFETIHPFADGNGRVGRALIHAVLARRSLVAGMALPVSPVLATLSRRYVAALTAFRAIPPGDAPAPTQEDDAHSGRLQWIAFFLEACTAACEQAEMIEAELADVAADWREKLATLRDSEGRERALRKDSAALRILKDLAATPALTPNLAMRFYGLSATAARGGLETLEAAKILTTVSIGPGRRAYLAPAILDTLAYAERRLASTQFDTRTSPPPGGVPAPPHAQG